MVTKEMREGENIWTLEDCKHRKGRVKVGREREEENDC